MAWENQFVGREVELGILDQVWLEAKRGTGRVVMLQGEPGMGKTRLFEEFSKTLTGQVDIAWSRCWAWGGAPAFWVWNELFKAIARCLPQGAQRQAFEENLNSMIEAAPDQRFVMFDTTATLLHELGAGKPFVLVIDDLHAADLASLELLIFIASRLNRTPLLILTTCRSVARGTSKEHDRRLDAIARLAVSINLNGLHANMITRFVEGRTGERLVPTLAASLAAATRGNPLFLDGVVRAAVSGLETMQRTGWQVAADVAATIQHRLERIGAKGRVVLGAIAVIGRSCDVSLVSELTGLAEEEVWDTVELTDRAGLLSSEGNAQELNFTHQLIGEEAYQALHRGRRAAMHGTLSRILEQRHQHNVEMHAAEILKHQMASGARSKEVCTMALSAGRYARRILGYEEAATHFRTASKLFDQEHHFEALMGLGDAEVLSGQPTAGRQAFISAVESARRSECVVGQAEASLGVARTGEFGVVDPEVRGLLQTSLEALGETQPPLRIRLLARLIGELWLDRRAEKEREVLSREAVALARCEESPTLLGVALAARMKAIWGPSHADERARLANELMDIALRTTNLSLQFEACRSRMNSMWELGNITEADRELEAYLRLGDRLKSPQAKMNGVLRRIVQAEIAGHLEQIEALLPVLEKLAIEAGDPQGSVIIGMGQLLVWVERGEISKAREHISDYEAMFKRLISLPAAACYKAYIYSLIGWRPKAKAALDQLLTEGVPATYGQVSGLCLLALAAVDVGEQRHVQTIYDQLLPSKRLNSVAGPGCCLGSVERYLGLLALQLGRRDDGIHHLRAAIDANRSFMAEGWMAHCQYELALALLEHPLKGEEETSEASSLLEAAKATTQRLGFRALLEKITHFSSSLPALDSPSSLSDSNAPTTPSPATPTDLSQKTISLKREGKGWCIEEGSNTFYLKPAKGLTYLSVLLQNPGVSIPALHLANPDLTVREVGAHSATEMVILDDTARKQYKKRMEELHAELEEAQDAADLHRGERLRAELEFIEDELLRRTGLGQRSRKTSGSYERARISVTNAIRRAIQVITKHNEPLGIALKHSIITGSACCYDVSRETSFQWIVCD